MDSIGGILNPIGQMSKHATKINFVMFYWKKLMVYNGILMETLGFLWWFLLHKAVNVITKRQSNKLSNEELNTETRANPDRSSEACLTTASRDVTATITVRSHRRRRGASKWPEVIHFQCEPGARAARHVLDDESVEESLNQNFMVMSYDAVGRQPIRM